MVFIPDSAASIIASAANIGGTAVTAGDDSITTVRLRAGVNYEVSEDFDVYGELWSQGYDDFTIGLIQFTDVSTTGASLGIRVKL